MKYIFYTNGKIWCSGEEVIAEEHLEAEGPENTALWRLSLDLETNTVVVKFPGKTDAEAEVLMKAELDAAEAAATTPAP